MLKRILSLSLALLVLGLFVALPVLAYAKPAGNPGLSLTNEAQPVESYTPVRRGPLQVTGRPFCPGSTCYISGKNFTPGATVNVYFDGQLVGQTTADSSGRINYTYAIPSDCRKGLHSISAEGEYKRGGTYEGRRTIVVFTQKVRGMNGSNTGMSSPVANQQSDNQGSVKGQNSPAPNNVSQKTSRSSQKPAERQLSIIEAISKWFSSLFSR